MWMGGIKGGWVEEWMGSRIDVVWIVGFMDEWKDGWKTGWMDGWMDGWMGGWVEEWMDDV